MAEETSARPEQDVFDDLATLCASPGYAHAIAYLCFRDNVVGFDEELTTEDIRKTFSRERLIRTEISTLIGLMVRSDLDLSIPPSSTTQEYINKTEALLAELHRSMNAGLFAAFTPELITSGFNPFAQGENLREPIFYGSESAYVFQYRDLAVRKYSRDDGWLLANRGFTIQMARDVARAIEDFQENKLSSLLKNLRHVHPDKWTLLPGFDFTAQELAQSCAIDLDIIDKVLNAFSLSKNERNDTFKSLTDFNATNALPLIPLDHGRYLLFQSYSFAEALYDTPFYWMGADKTYVSQAMQHRGQATEEFARESLERVFGKKHVFTNVRIIGSKGKDAGEIDVLVLFGNRAIVLQAKSKRLTLEARKGNDGQIKSDFKKSIQDSYDQGYLCANLLTDPQYGLRDAIGNEVSILQNLKEIYIVCLVSDHYPALSFQARQFLKTETKENIPPPFVMDMFTLDAMTEMLESPLRFLSYVDRRVKYSDRLMASHELTILSYHLKSNLWLDDNADMVMLGDDFSADLDVAMAARREGLPGQKTPDGILTRLNTTTLGKLVKDIESRPDPGTVDLGFVLLTLSEKTTRDISRAIETISARARGDSQNHDVTVAVADSGLTIHCNDHPLPMAEPSLRRHCENRKYTQRSRSWFGLCIQPTDSSVRFGMKLDYEWKQNPAMDERTKNLPQPTKLTDFGKLPQRRRKIGRNQPCPCGSGKKYKKCHGAA